MTKESTPINAYLLHGHRCEYIVNIGTSCIVSHSKLFLVPASGRPSINCTTKLLTQHTADFSAESMELFQRGMSACKKYVVPSNYTYTVWWQGVKRSVWSENDTLSKLNFYVEPIFFLHFPCHNLY